MTPRVSAAILAIVLAAGAVLAQPMGGSYTIRPSGGDFTDFSAACAALNSRGYTRSCTMWAYTNTYTAFGNAMNWSSDSVWVVFKAAPGQRPVQTYSGYGFNTTNTDRLVFDSIWFSTGNHCLYSPTSRQIVIRNCSLVTTGTGYGWSMSSRACRVENNVMYGNYGLYMFNDADSNVVIGNKIRARSSYGIYFSGTTYKDDNVFINNFVSGYSTRGWYGSYDSRTRFYFNSFYSSGSQPDLYLSSSNNLRAMNNIFHGGSTHCIYVSSGSIDTSNYNCFYTTSPYVAYSGGDRDWTAWRGLGYDANGINQNPQYVSPPADLHIEETSPCILAGAPYAGVAYDIDGLARHPSSPCIGADELIVEIHDVGASHLLAPSGTIDSGTVVTPACSVYNYGTETETYDVRMRIGAYSQGVTVTSHAAGTRRYVEFPGWTATQRGAFSARCSTELHGDFESDNDKATASGTVRVLDAGVVSITTPSGTYTAGATIAPAATWHNYGSVAASFEAWMCINDPTDGRVYAEKVDVNSLAPGADLFIGGFPSIQLNTGGMWSVRCSTYYPGDLVPANDIIDDQFTVGSPDVGVTAITAPTGRVDTNATVTPQGRMHNYGDCVCSYRVWFIMNDPTDAEVYREYVDVTGLAVGADTTIDFPTHNVGLNEGTWATRCSAYAVGDMQPGNDFMSGVFYVSTGPLYPPGWQEVTPMPAGTRAVKDGGWLAIGEEGGLIYAARGNKTGDFYSYDAVDSTWTPLTAIPNGTEAKPPYKG
ncbi:hypothetical protein FJY71_03400, partial [candidate division WOR-3 bacterium]|nr:hypothetical protein [candidate division WOR-3 bacterium]